MIGLLAAEITEAQLLIAGLLSGGGIVGIVVKWLVSSPERESAAYKAGVADEQKRCEQDVRELKERVNEQDQEMARLRNGLLRLALAADLTPSQRSDIATALGYDPLSMIQNQQRLDKEQKHDKSQ